MTRPRLPLSTLGTLLNSPARWRILAELIHGEPRSTQDFARMLNMNASGTSKHLAALRDAGLVVVKHRVNFIADAYRVPPGARELDLGGCVLRFDDPAWLLT